MAPYCRSDVALKWLCGPPCRSADKKAAIGYTYEDSTPVKPEENKEEEEEEEDDDDILSGDELDLGEEKALNQHCQALTLREIFHWPMFQTAAWVNLKLIDFPSFFNTDIGPVKFTGPDSCQKYWKFCCFKW